MNKLQKNKRSGSVLLLVVCILVVLLVAGIGYLSLASQSRLFAIHDSTAIVARSAADAGLQKIAYLCNKEFLRILPSGSWGGWTSPVGATGQNLGNGATYDYNTPAMIIAGKPQYGFTISAAGYYNEAQTDPCARLVLGGGPFDFGIFGSTGVDLGNNNIVTWNQSLYPVLDPPLQVGTNGNVALGNNTVINGNIVHTSGTVTGGGSATGQTTVSPTPINFDPKIVPTGVTWTSLGSVTGSQSLPAGNYQASSINLNSNGQTLTFTGQVTLWVTGNIDLTNKAGIAIPTGGSLTLYVGGNMNMNDNKITLGTVDPTLFKIYGLATCTNITIKNNPTIAAAIYAPTADVVMWNNADFIGGIIAKSVTEKNNGIFYYDPNLRNQMDMPGVHFQIERWSEVRSRKY